MDELGLAFPKLASWLCLKSIWKQVLPSTSYDQNMDSWSSANVIFFTNIFESYSSYSARHLCLFLLLFFFFFSLSCLFFFLASFLLCMIPHVLLYFYCFYDMDCILCLLFFFLYRCSLLVLSSSFLVAILSCSSLCVLPFNAKNNKQPATKHKHWESLRNTFLKLLTYAKIQESQKQS